MTRPMPLSVLQIATSFPGWGGTELHILNLSAQLIKRGHQVTVACRPGLWVEERAQEMGLPTVPITIKKQNDWAEQGKLRAFMRQNQTDVMHVHWSSDIVVAAVAALRERVPVRILSRHLPYPFKTPIGARFYSNFLYSQIVTVSASVRDTIVKSGADPNRVQVIHHGTDVAEFAHTTRTQSEMRAEISLPSDCVAVGIVGRIAPEKGHQFFVEAARLLGDRYPLRFVVVGDGPDEESIRQSVQEAGLGEKFVFTGFRADVNNVLNALDIITVPSVWNEPCSAVVQQGMALSKPIIGTRTGGTPEMVVENETGLLVPPSDAQGLADAIAALASDAFLRKRMGRAGRERVETLFSLRVMTDKLEELYSREYEKARGPQAQTKVLT